MIASKPPAFSVASATRSRHASSVSTALDRRVVLAGVPDHVGISVVHDDASYVPLSIAVDGGIGDLSRAHRRREIVRRHRTVRRDELSVFAFELVLAAAVEEIGDVRVLLGFGQPELAQSRFAPTTSPNVSYCGRGPKSTGLV